MSEPADAPPDQNAFEAGYYQAREELRQAINSLKVPPHLVAGANEAIKHISNELDMGTY